MSLLRNKKGVEALPLRYIIIALVAALVIGIALQFVGILRGGVISTAETTNRTLEERTRCELDTTGPTVDNGWLCKNDNYASCDTGNPGQNSTVYIIANASDNQGGCGLDDLTGVYAYVYKDNVVIDSVNLRLVSGDIYRINYMVDGGGTYYAKIYAKDKSPSANNQRIWNKTNDLVVS